MNQKDIGKVTVELTSRVWRGIEIPNKGLPHILLGITSTGPNQFFIEKFIFISDIKESTPILLTPSPTEILPKSRLPIPDGLALKMESIEKDEFELAKAELFSWMHKEIGTETYKYIREICEQKNTWNEIDSAQLALLCAANSKLINILENIAAIASCEPLKKTLERALLFKIRKQ